MSRTNEISDGPQTGGAFDSYLSRMSPIPRLTKEEEIMAGTIIQTRPDTAEADDWRQRLITGNLRLVVSAARKMKRGGVPIEELVAEGNRGLMTAAERYNPTRYGTRFSTYATAWIKLHIQKALADWRHIHLPPRRAAQLSRVMQAPSYVGEDAKEDLLRLSQETNLRADDVASCLTMPRYAVSLDHGAAGDEEDGRRIQLSDGCDDPAAILARREELEEPLLAIPKCLTPLEQGLVTCRYGLNGRPWTFRELADLHGLSHERIRQLIMKALKKLRKYLEGSP